MSLFIFSGAHLRKRAAFAQGALQRSVVYMCVLLPCNIDCYVDVTVLSFAHFLFLFIIFNVRAGYPLCTTTKHPSSP
jgi:hypothetical protein